jgi:RNase H-fold protein (predicted Holliday junction resolvase)
MNGKNSDQTNKILELKKELELEFKDINFFIQDERLSSKFAQNIQRNNSKKDKNKEHAIAASIILESFLEKQKNILNNKVD